MSKYNELVERLDKQRRDHIEASRAILDRAEKRDGSLTGAEQVDLNEHEKIIDRCEHLIKAEITRLDEERDATEAYGSMTSRFGQGSGKVEYGMPLPPGGRFASLPGAGNKTLGDFGEYMRTVLLPGGEARAQSVGTGSQGGFLVPTIYAAPLIDLTVAKMQVKAAGASVVPMGEPAVKIGRLDTDPTPAWRAEAAAIAESSAVFGNVDLVAKSLAVHIKLSLEVAEDAKPDFGTVLGNSMARAFALEVDRAALYGTGASNQPLGLKGQSGITITNFVGANGGQFNSTNLWYKSMVDTAARLRAKNYEPSGILYSERTAGQFGAAADTTGQPLVMPRYIADVPQFSTGQIPNNLTVGTSTDCSDYIVGDFRYLAIGLRSDLRVFPVNDAFMVSNGQLALVGVLRADVAVLRPAAFEILSGLRA